MTVCQLPDVPEDFEVAWGNLCEASAESDVVVLPELPFHPWVAWTDRFDQGTWDEAVAAHEKWIGRLGELGASSVVGSAPTGHDVRRNRAFTWADGRVEYGHEKYYLPDEPGFWEASWYRRGDGSFERSSVAGHSAGFLLCTELWFTDRAREYARQGIRMLLTPRVTELQTANRWIIGGQAAAIMSGAFSLSSNRSGSNNGVSFGGKGWVIDPNGNVLAVTSDEAPVATLDIDLSKADAAKSTYPRYVEE
ncbi:MAG: carbon-nitrogen hydrolase family protein [Acidimicrobiia bacterium]